MTTAVIASSTISSRATSRPPDSLRRRNCPTSSARRRCQQQLIHEKAGLERLRATKPYADAARADAMRSSQPTCARVATHWGCNVAYRPGTKRRARTFDVTSASRWLRGCVEMSKSADFSRPTERGDQSLPLVDSDQGGQQQEPRRHQIRKRGAGERHAAREREQPTLQPPAGRARAGAVCRRTAARGRTHRFSPPRVSVAEDGCVAVPDPVPERAGAPDPRARDDRVLVQATGVEADRAEQQVAAALRSEDGCVAVPDPVPERAGAPDPRARDDRVLVQATGVEADRAEQQVAAAL